MTDVASIAAAAVVSGSAASLASAAMLAFLARQRGASVFQPSNATSHWLHGPAAARVRGFDAPHTAVGLATHHASAIFWAAPFEAWLASRRQVGAGEVARAAVATAGLAAFVDYAVVPRRITPGWERLLPPASIAVGYGALAAGLFAGAVAFRRR